MGEGGRERKWVRGRERKWGKGEMKESGEGEKRKKLGRGEMKKGVDDNFPHIQAKAHHQAEGG